MNGREMLAVLLLATGFGCSNQPRIMGSPVVIAPSAAAHTRVQIWQTVGDLQLPSPAAESMNQQLSRSLYSSLPMPCEPGPATINRGQRALFDHLAALLQQRPQNDLRPFALGELNELAPDCRQLVLITGRLGGDQPGWLAAGVVSLPDGQLTHMTIERWPAAPRVSVRQVINLADQLIDRLAGSGS